jgi:hypothetical protein
MLSSHLTILEASAKLYTTSPAFKIPILNAAGSVRDWMSISYQQFLLDVERFARHWARVLRSKGVPQQSVVGLWYASHLVGASYQNSPPSF